MNGPVTERWRRLRAEMDRYRVANFLLAGLAAVVAVVLVTRVFPHHSLNHDEGVYLQQAELLLDGKLFLRPPVADAFRPWFFVESANGLYTKYAPVPAAVFALGKLLGGFPVALAGVAAAVVGLTSAIGRELFDGRTGILAGLGMLASPLFLVQAGVYLPYATTTALNLIFALAYLRAERRGSLRATVVAGVAVALAFFARPYTALLFVAPFVVHACWTLGKSGSWRTLPGGSGDRALLGRRLATATLGTAGVVAALGYNWVVTGDPLLFPYEAFAPEDGIGFGHRAILGHETEYTLELALRSNGQVLWQLFTDWVVAGPLGTVLAAVGVGEIIRNRDAQTTSRWALLAALFLTVPLGNLAFWGNFNVLGSLASQTDGLIYYLGPYYHFDLLVPTTIFAAHGAVLAAKLLERAVDGRLSPARPGNVATATLLVSAAVFGAVAVGSAAGPLERNSQVSDELGTAYEPFTDGGPTDAIVLLPEPYGPWLNHPFQRLRNDPSYDRQTLYALGDGNVSDVAAAYPDRTLYRYVYAGTWNPTDDDSVDPALRKVSRVEGRTIGMDAAMSLPASTEDVTIRLSTDEGSAYFVVSENETALDVTTTVSRDRARLTGANVEPTDRESVAVGQADELTVEAFVSTGGASGFTYRLVLPVERQDGAIRALSPSRERCQVPDRCVPVGVGEVPESSVRVAIGNGSS